MRVDGEPSGKLGRYEKTLDARAKVLTVLVVMLLSALIVSHRPPVRVVAWLVSPPRLEQQLDVIRGQMVV